MGDHSKREKRRQHAAESLDRPLWQDFEPPKCRCGAPARYEVNRGAKGIIFVCRKHVPDRL